MTTHTSIPQAINVADNTLALAVAVMRERLSQLSKEDQKDLFELLPAIVMGDEEERSVAILAANEIINSAPATLRRMDLSGETTEPIEPIERWLAFFSKKLRESREKAGLTQQQLAEKAGIPQSHVSRLENKQHSPSAKTIQKLAIALNEDPTYFDPSANDE